MSKGISGVTYYSNKKGQKLGQMILDFFSGCLRVITNLHAHTHEGKAFHIDKIVTGLADDAHFYIEMITPDDEDIHLKETKIWISEGPVHVKLLEDPTLTTGVTPIVPINRNRKRIDGSVLSSGVVAKDNPTGVSGGTIIRQKRFGTAGLGSQTNESTSESQAEIVLEQGERTYLIDIQNLSGGNIDISAEAIWYE